MRMSYIMLPRLFVFSALAFGLFYTSPVLAQDKIGEFKDNDGTYSILSVRTPEECTALCQADTKCRGAVTYQADITKDVAECRLNDGFGENSPFPNTPPKPLNLEFALADLNNYRAEYGLNPLRLSEKLNLASEVHAKDIAQAGIISHTGTDGSSHGDRVQRQGYYFTIAAENVATGQKSWEEAFQGWKDSPEHNENLLRNDVTDFGIALVYEPKTTFLTYWSMVVATPIEEL